MEPNDSSTVGTETTGETSETTSQTFTLDDVKNLLTEALDPINGELASLKRTAKKVKVESKGDTLEKTQSDDSGLLEQVNSLKLQVAGINQPDEIKLFKDLQTETGLDTDKLLTSKYFKAELEDLRTERANAAATSGVKGDQSGGSTKSSAAYWIAKGEYPSHEQVSDRKVRAEIRAALVNKEKGATGKFYNS